MLTKKQIREAKKEFGRIGGFASSGRYPKKKINNHMVSEIARMYGQSKSKWKAEAARENLKKANEAMRIKRESQKCICT